MVLSERVSTWKLEENDGGGLHRCNDEVSEIGKVGAEYVLNG